MTRLFLLASLLSASLPVRAAEIDPAKLAAIHKAVAAAGDAVRALTDRMAGDYIQLLRGSGGVFEKKGIRKSSRKEAFIAGPRSKIIAASIETFDSSAARMSADAPKPLVMAITQLLAVERGRLEDFLHENPLTALEVIRVSSASVPAADLIERVEQSASKGDFAARLRLAAPRGDAAVRRLVMRTVARPATALTDKMAASDADFVAGLSRTLDEQGVKDPDQKHLLLAGQRRKHSEPMLAQYDRFAAATKKSFAGAGVVIERAADDALARERGRLNDLLESDASENDKEKSR